MPTREQLWLWGVMFVVAIWGGAISYYRKLTTGLQHTWLRALGEIGTSALAGLGVGVLTHEGGFTLAWSVAFAGIAGHMGSSIFDLGTEILTGTLKALASRGGKAP